MIGPVKGGGPVTDRCIGVGVVGLGWMGRLHSRSYRALAEKFPELRATVRLVSACDAQPETRKAAVEGMGFQRAVEDYREVIADPEVDVVSICSPNFLHREIALAAAAAGKPFWIEKPMGTNAVQSRDIAEAARAAGLVTAVGFNYRHAPAIERARELIRGGRLGRITNVRCWLIADYASSPDGPLTWRDSREYGGSGVIGDLMSHGVDLVQYLVGRIESVTAATGQFITERPIPLKAGVGHSGWEVSDKKGPVENEDWIAMIARLEGGALATLEASRVATGPRAEYIVEVYGSDGSVRWNFEHLNDLLVAVGRGQEFAGYTHVMAGLDFPRFGNFQPSPGTSMGFDDLKVVEASQFIGSVIAGQQLAPSVYDGLAAAEVDEAAMASAADGRWHDVRPVEGVTHNR
ncbi:Gfo/Idh/MocA family protein [Tessaracoccus sp. ZS01]|uniref:Gfo/Idh/MocA family protein n=1 Tax=Tessaracoccus sp. ZS01 TaxID=1906324 RepID=UPI00096F6ABB|nr:Gfo/Idh/MocA family oxidoreductase [Tessaracoccus sp. ZS01]MCG6567443.1 gfo/Idh/MocA family oxidoreductase [Tessaracoccus sp. ZS01]OMG57010.1 myo-inositol 2-dehydrogenase [Tessaracoccus sp. ZS01]